jgi:hypothetical protein
MKLNQLEHLLRAAGAITEVSEFYVIGSQAILPSLPPGREVPQELWRSMEADLAPVRHPERWELIEGSIGEGSPFHETFGYHADGVEEGTAILPSGWKGRVIHYRSPDTGGVTGLCLEPHDLLISKFCAGRGPSAVATQVLQIDCLKRDRHDSTKASAGREMMGATRRIKLAAAKLMVH